MSCFNKVLADTRKHKQSRLFYTLNTAQLGNCLHDDYQTCNVYVPSNVLGEPFTINKRKLHNCLNMLELNSDSLYNYLHLLTQLPDGWVVSNTNEPFALMIERDKHNNNTFSEFIMHAIVTSNEPSVDSALHLLAAAQVKIAKTLREMRTEDLATKPVCLGSVTVASRLSKHLTACDTPKPDAWLCSRYSFNDDCFIDDAVIKRFKRSFKLSAYATEYLDLFKARHNA